LSASNCARGRVTMIAEYSLTQAVQETE